MRELALTFKGKGEVKGYNFTQIHYNGKCFVYEVEHDGHKHYEIFKRRKRVSRLGSTNGMEYIAYPSSNAFGVWAFTTMDIKKCAKYISKLSLDKNKNK
jgi:hypothetical protein